LGAAAFYVCYGVKREVDIGESSVVNLLECRLHPWQLSARRHQLTCWWGITVDERKFFVLLGQMIGRFGLENAAAGRLSDAEASSLMVEARDRLRAAGVDDEPAWHFQFEPDR
jgi:hypothetical protein